MSKTILYHGSKISGIKLFEPKPHFISQDRGIVFATDDKNYALAMIYGTGDELAVSYVLNPETNKKEMYIDELHKGKLDLLKNEGYLYEVDRKHFEPSPEGLEGEYISYSPVSVLSEIKVGNLMVALKKSNVHLISYDNVLESMKSRGNSLNESVVDHQPNRFKE